MAPPRDHFWPNPKINFPSFGVSLGSFLHGGGPHNPGKRDKIARVNVSLSSGVGFRASFLVFPSSGVRFGTLCFEHPGWGRRWQAPQVVVVVVVIVVVVVVVMMILKNISFYIDF